MTRVTQEQKEQALNYLNRTLRYANSDGNREGGVKYTMIQWCETSAGFFLDTELSKTQAEALRKAFQSRVIEEIGLATYQSRTYPDNHYVYIPTSAFEKLVFLAEKTALKAASAASAGFFAAGTSTAMTTQGAERINMPALPLDQCKFSAA